MKKDYCSAFPEKVNGIDISECCKQHDDDCTEGSGKSFKQTYADFYKCLKDRVGRGWAFAITFGGTLGCAVRYPVLAYKMSKIKRKNKAVDEYVTKHTDNVITDE